jgi:hypothetical protein
MTSTNTLVYYVAKLITTEKSFIAQIRERKPLRNNPAPATGMATDTD